MYPNNDGERLLACLNALHATPPAPCAATALNARAKPDPVQYACAVCFVIARD